MEKKEITTVNPVTVAGVTIIPISKVSTSYRDGKRGVAFSGSQQPVGVIIVTPSEKRAFRINGEEITLDQLVLEFPDIKEILEKVYPDFF